MEEKCEGQESSPNEPFLPSLQFLSPEELSDIKEDIKCKMVRALAELSYNFSKSETERRKDKVLFDQQIYDLDSQLREQANVVENANASALKEKENCEVHLEKHRNAMAQLSVTEGKVGELERELNTSQAQFSQSTTEKEKEDLLSLVERRNAEIDTLVSDLRDVNEQLQSAIVSKIEALAKVDEMTSKEMELDYKEKQVEKEREWVSKEVQLLNEALDKKNVIVIEIQREASVKYLCVQTELAEKSEELRIAEMSLENVKMENDNQAKHIESLVEKLKEEQSMKLKMEENFRQEKKSQEKIAQLYKESSEEAGRKVEELENAVSNLQSLLKESTERYGEIETHLATTQTKLQDEINERDKNMETLHKELSDANELLSTKQQGLTDEMIESLSPAAAAASAMLKSSHSLTEIYSRYQTVYTEFIQTKEENEKLNGYINQILQEITERAPSLRRQKDDYERCLKTIDTFTTQLDLNLKEINDSKIENGQLQKTLASIGRENSRLKVQLKDMALQIKSLVKEVELNRGNYSFADLQDETSVVPSIEAGDQSQTSSTRVITEHLVTFRNIDELQAQNQHLLSLVRERELNESHISSEKEISISQLKAVQDALVDAKLELENLKELKTRQESMIEKITQQRDMFADLVKKRTESDELAASQEKLSVSQEKIDSLEKTIKENETLMQKLKEEYDTLRKEKSENDKLTNDKLFKLRDDLSQMRTDNAKLASQTEYNNERAKIYTTNLETYKKNILVLEEKNKQCQLTIIKHEQSMDTVKMELTTMRHNLARAEANLNTAVQERNVLRDDKARLQAERDLFNREHSTQQMLQLNLQEIKNGLEKVNSAGRIKLENQIECIQQENKALRKKIETDSDRFKEAVAAWDTITKDLQAKLDLQDKELESLTNEVFNSQEIITTQRMEIDGLLNKVGVLTGSISAGKVDQSMDSSTPSSPNKESPLL